MIYLVTKQIDLFDNDIYKIISVEESLNMLNSLSVIGFDTETTGLDAHSNKIIILQLGNSDFQIDIDINTIDINLYKHILEDENIIKVGANLKFDYQFCLSNNIVCKNLYDVLLSEYVINNGLTSQDLYKIYNSYISDYKITDKKLISSYQNKAKFGYYSLFSLVYKYFKVVLDKEIRNNINEGLTDRVIKYSALDVEYLLPIRDIQLNKAKETNCIKAINLENKFLPVLAYTEYCGIKLNIEKWLEQYNRKVIELNNVVKTLNQFIIDNNIKKFINKQLDLFDENANYVTINWDSDKDVFYIFSTYLGFELKNKDGKNSTEADVIKKYINKHPLVEIYLKYSSLAKDTSTYGKTFLDNINKTTGRIHPNFNQLVNTSRLSCKNPNLQNIPATAEYRECFIPEKNNILIDSDYSGQESIILVNFSLDPSLLEFYDKNIGDLHSYVAKLTFIEELKDIEIRDVKSKRKDLRNKAKGVEFAVGYGGTGFTISNNIGVSKEEGDRIYNAYFKAFPGLKNYFKEVGDFCEQNGYVLISKITGRKYYFPFYSKYLELKKLINNQEFWNDSNNKIKYKEEIKLYFQYKGSIQRIAQNYPIQGSSAEVTKIAAIYLYDWILNNDYLFKVLIPNQVHDELLLECPTELNEIVQKITKECMERSGKIYCKRVPLLAEPESANYWIH